MKKRVQYFVVATLLVMVSFSSSLMAQPDPGSGKFPGDPGGGGPPVGAPVGNGVIILIALAVAYGLTQLYFAHKQKTVVS